MATRNTGGSEGTRGTTPSTADLGRKTTRDVAGQAESRVDRTRHDAAVTLSSVASRLRQSGTQLRGDDHQDFAGEYVERAAQQIERAAKYVQTADIDEVVEQVEDFARRRPVVFIGGAFALGILAARYFSNSRPEHRLGTGRYADREVSSRVASETGRSTAPSDPWRGTI